MINVANRIPMRTWVDVRDPFVRRQLVGLINDYINGLAGDHDGVEIALLSRHDPDAPKDLAPPVPGQRHFQVDVIADTARLRFIVGVLGRPGSELLGYTADELRAAAGGMHKVITLLRRGGKLSADSLATLQESARMLEFPPDEPTRMQPIGASDAVVAYVCAEPEVAE
jgi:hypothetical protein